MPLNQQDLELFSEQLAKSMVKAQCEAMERADTLTKVKKGAANIMLSGVGALVAFMILGWAGEYRESAKKAHDDAQAALTAASEARTLAKGAKTDTSEFLSGLAALDARLSTLTDSVATLSAKQQTVATIPDAPAELPAAAVQEKRAELLKEQDKAVYRKQLNTGMPTK